MTEILGDVTVNGYVITESCSPEVVVALIDYLMSPEGTALMNLGVEGETYTREADGTVRFTEYVSTNPNSVGGYRGIECLWMSDRTSVYHVKGARRSDAL